METHPSILAWRIPWTEEPGGVQSMGSQKNWTQLSTKCTPNRLVLSLIFPLLDLINGLFSISLGVHYNKQRPREQREVKLLNDLTTHFLSLFKIF